MKKAVILLNMGGARNKRELKEFLSNMFLDKRIIRTPLRYIISPLIVFSRLNEAWKNYELIGGSKIYDHTQNLVGKVNALSKGSYDTFFAMRYTSPRVAEVLRDKSYDEVLLFPLYPHFSSTTTLSSFDDAESFLKNRCEKTLKIERFFEDEHFNSTIIESIKKHYKKEAHLIFSAHSLPISIAKNDAYLGHIKSHIEILSKMLEKNGLKFEAIHLAFQSKLGPVKWLEPNLSDVLAKLPKVPVVVYPISFTIDNSETDFELSIYYKNIAAQIGINSYKVCEVQNDSDDFAEFISNKIKSVIN